MEWLLIIALGVWVWLQHQRLNTLTTQVKELEWRLGLGADRAPAPAPPEPETERPVAANAEPEPLLLDTPLPEASNDELDLPAPEAVRPRAEPVLELIEPLIAEPPEPQAKGRGFEQWLAENGLAWIGGGALALGAAFLVTFAAQQGFFTPGMRLIAAVLLGAVLIGASEYVRRQALRSETGNPLVGALLAGAGAASLYVTVWAAFGLYHYIDAFTASVLLTLISALLIALSHLHGQALGALAIGAAMLAPALTNGDAWPSLALTLFICAVAAAGFALAAFRRWSWTALTALAGVYVWFAACVAADELNRAIALLCVGSLGAASLALRPGTDEEKPSAALRWTQVLFAAPTAAICVGSVLMLWTWLSAAPAANASPVGAALAALFHAGLAALAIRRRLVHPAAFAVAAGAATLGLLLYVRTRVYFAPGGVELYVWPLIVAGGLAIAALGARPHHHGRTLVAASGAVSAALLIIIAAFSRPFWTGFDVWCVLLAGALLFVGAAWVTARSVSEPRASWPVDAWVYGAGALALIGMESLAPVLVRPAAHAALALAFAWLATWRGWRGAGVAALSAAAFAFTHAAAPDFSGAVMAGEEPLLRALLFIAAAAAFVFGASQIIKRQAQAPNVGDGLHSAFVLLILLGLFLALRWYASGHAGATLDPYSENALRALMLMAAGYITLPRGDDWTIIARIRGHVFFACGLLMALFSSALLFHPWWGEAPANLVSPPLLNANAFALLAPAALSIAAARLLYGTQRFAARAYACAAGLFGLIWAVTEIRFTTHGFDMIGAEVGLLEGDAYGLVFLLGAVLIAVAARLRARTDDGPFTQDLNLVMRACAFAGLGLCALFLLLSRNAWWGGQNPALSDDVISFFAVLTLAVAVALSLVLGRALSQGPGMDAARFAAACGAALFALAFGHDAIRWLHHLGAMDDNPARMAGLEGFAHALWPLALVLGGAELTRRAPGRDTIRFYLYDLQAIWANAAWPALIWAALGLWLAFNPWWGTDPAFAQGWFAALIGLSAFAIAAWLSLRARQIPHLRAQAWFDHAAMIAATGHVFVALSLIVRRIFHGDDMRAALSGSSLETWSYSALWALFAAIAWMIGSRRRNITLRRAGLALLLFVAGKVLIFDTATLDGVIRAASVIGAGVVLSLVALAARRFGGAQARD
ncbi:MAG: DUF2339 domain-containing protein [Hyphomonadaceae bacterium]|nr:DUF2339 domain-containing protein [Hyphomonadaceae bacterium]